MGILYLTKEFKSFSRNISDLNARFDSRFVRHYYHVVPAIATERGATFAAHQLLRLLFIATYSSNDGERKLT